VGGWDADLTNDFFDLIKSSYLSVDTSSDQCSIYVNHFFVAKIEISPLEKRIWPDKSSRLLFIRH
jgi:hypothetical protein